MQSFYKLHITVKQLLLTLQVLTSRASTGTRSLHLWDNARCLKNVIIMKPISLTNSIQRFSNFKSMCGSTWKCYVSCVYLFTCRNGIDFNRKGVLCVTIGSNTVE